MQRIWLFLLLLATLVSSALGATRTVCATGATYTTIQAAITASNAGDTISICDGTYNENNIQISKNNLTILGASGNRANVIVNHSGDNIFVIQAANATIKNLTIVSSTYGIRDNYQASGSHTFENLVFNTSDTSIYLSNNASACSFKKLAITTNISGIYLAWNIDGAHIFQDITISARYFYGIYAERGAGSFSNVNITSGNTGIYLGNKYLATFDTLSITSTGGYGIYLANNEDFYYNYTFANLSINSYNAGLDINKGGTVTVSNSTIMSTAGYGIHLNSGVNGNHQFSNLSIDSSSTGLYVEKGGTVTVSNSTVTSTASYGIHLDSGVNGNHQFSNLSINSSSMGLYVEKGGKVIVKDSNITSSASRGINFLSGVDGAHEFSNLTVTSYDIAIYAHQGAGLLNNIVASSTAGDGIYVGEKYPITADTITVTQANGRAFALMNTASSGSAHTFSNLNLISQYEAFYVENSGKITINNIVATSTLVNAVHFLWNAQGAHEIRKAKIRANSGTGIYSAYGIGLVEDFSIVAQGYGIWASNYQNTTIHRGTIAVTNSDAIHIDSGSNKTVTIEDVSLSSQNLRGIHLATCSSALINRVCISKATDGIYTEWNANSVTITNTKINGNSAYGVSINSNPSSGTKAIVNNNCFLKSPFAYRNNIAHIFTGNYWNGTLPSGYDTAPLSSCPVSSCYVINPSVTVNYRMDECSWKGVSEEVQDSSGKNYNATAKGTTLPQLSYQIINNGALFQRAKQKYVELPALQINKPNFNVGFTITTWAAFSGNASDGSWERIFDFGNGTNVNNIFLGRSGTSNDLVLGIHESTVGSQYLVATDAILDKNWHFWAVSCSSDSCTLYRDGNSIASSTTMKIPSNTVRTTNYIGKSNWSADAYFEGGIDEFKVFDDSLTTAQISTIYTNELAKKNYDGTVRTTGMCDLPTCFTDTFDRTTLGSKWSIIKAQNYTPNITDYKLMLTDTNASIATGVSITGDFPSANNLIEIEFEHNAYGGTGADGMAVVLSDANTTPIAGSYGGSLGYANRTGQNGFAGGWLGFGLDEYGNFSNPTEGRNGGLGFRQDAFAIRGSGSGQTGYSYITGTTSLSPGIDSTTASNYKYKLTIDTRYNQTIVSVGRDASNSGTYTPILINADATQTAAAPARFKLSLTGSTGDSNNYHSIDNLSIKALQCGTLGQEQIINNFFDAWDTGAAYNINNRKIQTKIVNSSFNVNIASLNTANSAYQNFNGTTCVRVVDSTDTPLTNWSKLLFTASNPTINTVSLQSSTASKDNRIRIKWKKDQDIACDTMEEDNSTKSSDNFAIRPNNFSSTITANQTFIADKNSSIIFQANQYGGTGATNYNESINGSFKVDVNISDPTKTCAINSIQFSPTIGFNNGISTSSLYSLPNVGNYTVSMYEIAGSEFAKVDSADTPDTQRYITPYAQTITVVPSTFLITGAFSNGSNGFTYLSNFEQFTTSPNRDISAPLDLNISARSATNALLSNYTALCYAKDANLTLSTNTIGTTLTNLSKFLWYEKKHDLNGTVTLANSSSYRIPLSKALFDSTTRGMAETNYLINFDRNSTKPVQPFRFTIQNLTTTDADLASGAVTLNQNATFYYGRVYSTDYRGPIPNILTTIRYEVYCKDCNTTGLNALGKQSPTSLSWYQNPLHTNTTFGNVSQFTKIGTTTIANPNTSTINANGFDTSHTLTLPNTTNAPYVDRILMTPSAWLLFNAFNANATTNDFNVEFTRAGNWSGAGNVDRNDTSHTTGAFTNDTNITRGNRKMNW